MVLFFVRKKHSLHSSKEPHVWFRRFRMSVLKKLNGRSLCLSRSQSRSLSWSQFEDWSRSWSWLKHHDLTWFSFSWSNSSWCGTWSWNLPTKIVLLGLELNLGFGHNLGYIIRIGLSLGLSVGLGMKPSLNLGLCLSLFLGVIMKTIAKSSARLGSNWFGSWIDSGLWRRNFIISVWREWSIQYHIYARSDWREYFRKNNVMWSSGEISWLQQWNVLYN